MECFITGIKGFGKTAHALDLVFLQDSEFKGMDVYVEGISFTEAGHLACPHFDFPSLSEVKNPDFKIRSTVDNEDEEAEKYKPWLKSNIDYADFLEVRATAKHPIELWFLWAPKNSVIFIDEAQRFYRPRPSGAKVPLHIRMIEVARHYGLHFVFLSQAPRFVDINLRTHIEKHIHLDKTWKGGLKFESVGCMDIDSKADRKDAVKTAYSPPKHVFPFYHSSCLHLKVKHKIPKAIYVLAVSIPLFFILLYVIVQKVKADHFDKKPIPEVAHGQVTTGLIVPAPALPASAVSVSPGEKTAAYLKEFEPVVPARPETAPAYDGLRKVVVMPQISACVKSKKSCICYSQQASRLREISPERCAQILENGQDFNPYQNEVRQVAQAAPVVADKLAAK